MKLIKTINAATSAYAGNKRAFTDFSFKASPKTDENGNELPPNKRYYVLRFLSFEGPDRTDYPFIQRNEHICYHRDENNKVIGVDRIVCPTTSWAKNKLYQQGEKIEKGYCPICQYSFDKNREAWKIPSQPDKVSARLANETKTVWSVYMPVYVVSDPHYEGNNKHLRVLRLSGNNGKETLERITSILNENMSKGINVYNGEMGINIGFLCEAVQKTRTNKNGEPSINKKTGKPYVYTENVVTDIRPMLKKQYAYPEINDAAIDELDFDGIYGNPASKSELTVFLNKNWLDIGGGADDFEDVVDNNEFEAPSTSSENVESMVSANTKSQVDEFEESTDDSDFSVNSTATTTEKSTDEMIGDILGTSIAKSSVSTVSKTKITNKVIPPSVEEIRNDMNSGTGNLDDLPF